MKVGDYIRDRRQAAGLSLRDVARALQVDPAYLSRVEQSKVSPSEALLQQAAHAIGVDPDELLLLAGRLPRTWQEAIANSPNTPVEAVRGALAHRVAEPVAAYYPTVVAFAGTRAIEDDAFPFEQLSDIAELESWRKELSRPIYHMHKWWAQRLGSVFRAVLLSCFAAKGSNVLEMFYQPARINGAVVFDPFMGSGTTIGEALKLGARAIGRDINPVAHFAVRNALGTHTRVKVLETFRAIEGDVARHIRRFYQARLPGGATVDVLYYFWVKALPCPSCKRDVDLFSSYIFAQHAYPAHNPQARAVCPKCGSINNVRYDAREVVCNECQAIFDPASGPARGTKAACPHCGHVFPIAKTVQALGEPPRHRLYAKMVLKADGSKDYLPADEFDLALYADASRELGRLGQPYPVVEISPGYNTDQILNYCYKYWHQMFNERQLLCIQLLSQRIHAIQDKELRGLFACLLSGTLEFNNMFASFKGEGTGAVRHMFSHHILKPERTPLEANLWGTPRSSGSFSTLFESRLLRALDYADNPFELRIAHRNGKLIGEKIYGLSCPLGNDIAGSFAEFEDGKAVYLSCGDSAHTDLGIEAVDAVVTDPPFFDNVHYSELADFFYVWQQYVLGADQAVLTSTRSPNEVQHSDPATFAERLGGVWAECYRVLKRDGILVFTYHHSRQEGWRCVLEALHRAGFAIVAVHPIKAELSVAAPKHQAKEPIDLDVIIVCRKRTAICPHPSHHGDVMKEAESCAKKQVQRLNSSGRLLSRNDVRVVVSSNVIASLSWRPGVEEALDFLRSQEACLESVIRRIHEGQQLETYAPMPRERQLELW